MRYHMLICSYLQEHEAEPVGWIRKNHLDQNGLEELRSNAKSDRGIDRVVSAKR
jgi:hypothetical protein